MVCKGGLVFLRLRIQSLSVFLKQWELLNSTIVENYS